MRAERIRDWKRTVIMMMMMMRSIQKIKFEPKNREPSQKETCNNKKNEQQLTVHHTQRSFSSLVLFGFG